MAPLVSDIDEKSLMKNIKIPSPLVTIDSASTRDIDDALGIEQLADGRVRVVICIADPTDSVPLNGSVDLAARELACTVYARDRVVQSMLPRSIAESQGSLIQGQERSVFVFELLINEALDVDDFRIGRQSATVDSRLTYDQIPAILADVSDPRHVSLRLANALSSRLASIRRKRGALAFYDLKRLVYLDEEGRVVQLGSVSDVAGHIIIQEMMVLVNTAVARYMASNDILGLYRNHQSKAAAPSGGDLAQTLETWFATDNMDAQSAQDMMRLLVGRAEYATTANGHYALAVPCYAHCTSPLRRYADLVNLRQIAAHLAGDGLPHTREQLEGLANHLNQAVLDRKEERSQHYKAAVAQKAAQAIESGDTRFMAEQELSQAINFAVDQSTDLPPALTKELTRRFDENLVTDKIVDRLVQRLRQDQWTSELREAMLGWLRAMPARAVSVLSHANQAGHLPVLECVVEGHGDGFKAVIALKVRDGQRRSFSARGERKKEAEQQASIAAVAWLVGSQEEPHSRVAAEPAPGQRGINPKGQLLEMCQKHGWPMPTYSTKGHGPAHAMHFSCEIILNAGKDRLRSSATNAGTKKDAEALASLSMLQMPELSNVASSESAAAHSKEEGGLNAIGELQNLAQKHRWHLPLYSMGAISEVPPLFEARVTVQGPQPGTYTGRASTKQGAKREAALSALRAGGGEVPI